MLTRRASARSRPAHRCLPTILDTGLSVTGSPLRRGERVRKGGPRLRGSLPGTRSLVWGRGHPTSQSRPGSPAPHHGLRVSDPRHRLKAFLYTSALRCTPYQTRRGGVGLTHGWIGIPPCLWVSPQPPVTPLTVEGTPDPRAPCTHGMRSLCSARFPPRSEDWTQVLIVPPLDFKFHLQRLPAASACPLLIRWRPSVCLSRGSGGPISGASQTSARLRMARPSLPGPPRGLHLPSGHASLHFPRWLGTGAQRKPCAAPSPLFWNVLPAPHCPGLSFPHEAPSPLAPSPPPGFSHFLFRFGSFGLESHSRETQPGAFSSAAH